MNFKRRVITVTGISCSGKTFLADYARKNDTLFKESIGTTTRPLRAGEATGVDYDFVSVDEFKRMEQNGELLESNCYADNYYGRSVHRMEKIYETGKIPLFVVEPNGAINIRKKCQELGIEAVNVFIDCSMEVAIQRWLDRYQVDVKSGLTPHEFYADRISKTLTIEQTWKNSCNYHLTLGFASSPEETANQIQTIADSLEFDIPQLSIKDLPKANNSNLSELKAEIAEILTSNGGLQELLRAPSKVKSAQLTKNGVSMSC